MKPDNAAIAQLRELVNAFPREPFRDRPRRPNGYRNTPEYRQWQQDTCAHENRIHQWHKQHIQIVAPDPQRLEIHVAGQALPPYSAVRQTNGAIYITPQMPPAFDPAREKVMDLPTRPLELPGPEQDLGKWLSYNARRQSDARRWDLAGAVCRRFSGYHDLSLHLELPATRPFLAELNQEYLERLRQWIDYRRLTRLIGLSGGALSRPWTLLDYWLLITSGDILEATAATSPGAVAGWLYWWLESGPENSGRCMTMPRHPGMIIQEVRNRCRQSHPQAWKVLAAMPASRVRQMLRRQRNGPAGLNDRTPDNWELLLWTAERIRAAQTGRPNPPARPDPELTQMLLRLRYAPATVEPERELRVPGVPREPYYLAGLRNPPTPAALAAAELRGKAMDHFTELALAHFADLSLEQDYPQPAERRRFQANLSDLADYCRAEPAAARQKRSYNGLRKASHRWHQNKALAEIAAERARQEAAAAAEYADAAARGIELPPWDQPWPCPLTEYRAAGWTARLLATPEELFQESIVMRHCIGAGQYRSACAAGYTRVFHLQPDGPEGERKRNDDPEAAARRWGSTLELENLNANTPDAPPNWQPVQHRAALNALPPNAAEDFAAAVAVALNQAAAKAAAATRTTP